MYYITGCYHTINQKEKFNKKIIITKYNKYNKTNDVSSTNLINLTKYTRIFNFP